jgi:hypothetical protein
MDIHGQESPSRQEFSSGLIHGVKEVIRSFRASLEARGSAFALWEYPEKKT